MYNNNVLNSENFFKMFKPKREICVGDIGIYQDVLSVNTSNDATHTLNYDIFVKLEAIAVYENLVEVKILDTFTINSTNQEINNIINANIPKYIKPKYIKWEIK